MYAGDRSVIVSLAEANRLAQQLDPTYVGVIIDVYHLWWDPDIYDHIAAATGRILGFHVCDWLVPAPDLLLRGGLMGDGIHQLRRPRPAGGAAGRPGRHHGA